MTKVCGDGGGSIQAGALARVAAVAGRQWGVVSGGQLVRCGVSPSTVRRWAAAGYLHRIHRGVYAVGHAVLPIEGRLTAALFRAGPGSALSHATAAWWWGLIDESPEVIDVSVDRRRARADGVRFHHVNGFERRWHRRLPVTSVPWTLVDLAGSGSVGRARRALAEAEFQGLIKLAEVEAVLRRGRLGSAALRAALERHLPVLAHTRSELERRFIGLCESAGLPIPEVNVRLCGYRVDSVWRDRRVVVELDGHRGHRTHAQLESDHRRDLALRRAGFIVLRYTWRQVTQEPKAVVADLRAALCGPSSGAASAAAL